MEPTDLAVHSLEARLALADVLIKNVSSPGWSNELTQPVILTGVRIAGSCWEERLHSEINHGEPSQIRPSAFSRTRLGQVAGISTEAIGTNADEGLVPDPSHARPPVAAVFHLTEVTCESTGMRVRQEQGTTGS